MKKTASFRWSIKDKADLCAATALAHFNGLTIQEAELLFQAGGHFYVEDLSSMPDEAFNFYLLAFTNYLLSEHSSDDADSASAFIDLVKLHEEENSSKIKVNINEIKEALIHIAHNQKKYNASIEIYGDFHSRTESLMKVLNA